MFPSTTGAEMGGGLVGKACSAETRLRAFAPGYPKYMKGQGIEVSHASSTVICRRT